MEILDLEGAPLVDPTTKERLLALATELRVQDKRLEIRGLE